MKNIVKIVAALVTLAGAIFLIATYGEKIVAWCKEMLAKLPKAEAELEEDFVAEEAEEPAAEEVAEEPAAEEVVPEEVAAEEPVADEADFE